MNESAIFPAKIEHLPVMLNWIENQLPKEKSVFPKIELACEEVIVNIIKHGYKNFPGSIEIGVKILPKHEIQISFKDEALPFNPLEHQPTIDPSIPLEERPLGGLGIHLICQTVDQVFYAREKGKNVLILIIQPSFHTKSQ